MKSFLSLISRNVSEISDREAEKMSGFKVEVNFSLDYCLYCTLLLRPLTCSRRPTFLRSTSTCSAQSLTLTTMLRFCQSQPMRLLEDLKVTKDELPL